MHIRVLMSVCTYVCVKCLEEIENRVLVRLDHKYLYIVAFEEWLQRIASWINVLK